MPPSISFYEFICGVVFMSIFLPLQVMVLMQHIFSLSASDWICLFILASICTAYAFIASIHVMKHITPYTVVLTYNLEPIYGIVLALFLFPETETMRPLFYIGACLIISLYFLMPCLKTSIN